MKSHHRGDGVAPPRKDARVTPRPRRGQRSPASRRAPRRRASNRKPAAHPRRRWVRLILLAVFVLGCAAAAGLWAWLALDALGKAEKLQRARLAAIAPLSAEERGALRRFLNPEHLRIAERHGVGAIADRAAIDRLLAEGRLVGLADSDRLEVAPMTHGVAAVTPATRDALEQLATRFQAKLHAQGMPGYRPRVTSATRSLADQKALATTNRNAAAQSSHTRGVSVDLHSQRFGAPSGADVLRSVSGLFVPLLKAMGLPKENPLDERAVEGLQATLGRTLIELQDADELRVILESRQPVFHVTRAPGD